MIYSELGTLLKSFSNCGNWQTEMPCKLTFQMPK